MADHSELMRLVESLNRTIEQAEHKPGQWAETAQSMGGICCAGEPFQIGKPWAKEEPWAHFSYKRDSWLAVAAVNALPQLMALIAEVERLRTAEGDAMTYKAGMVNVARQRDQLKAENAGLKTGYEAYEQVNAGLKAELKALRLSLETCADELEGQVIQCYHGQPVEDMHPVTRRSYDRDMACVTEARTAMGQEEQS